MTIQCSLDMSLTREEFLRLLPAAVGLEALAMEEDSVVHAEGDAGWRIRLTPLPDLRLGNVTLPRHRVEMAFEGYGPEAIEAFMARFERHFRRGGG